jgi:hypothetical protein
MQAMQDETFADIKNFLLFMTSEGRGGGEGKTKT